ncbi:MAG TPA: MATE family efflux transporter, partial [Paracoccaceae bacterium]|nr:MATE family efflux transporter [Paracoccaceae bacterium]
AITLISMPLLGVSMGCSGTLRAVGAARQAMWVTLSGGIMAAALDPILIFGLGLELTGAAISMVAIRGVMAGLGLWFVVKRHRMAVLPRLREWVADLRPLLAIALPAIATQLSTPFGNAYLTSTVAEYGDGAVAGWAVIGRLSALAFGGIFALAGAVGPIVGQNYGARLPDRIRSTYRDSLAFVLLYVAVAWGVLWLCLGPIVAGFGLDEAGAGIVAAFVHGGAGAFVFTGALFVSNAAFNNLGRPIWSTAFNWTRDALAIPVLAALIGPVLGLAGAVWIQAIAAALVGSLAAVTGWLTVTRMAPRAPVSGPVHGAVGPAPVPPFASARAATGISVEEVPDGLESTSRSG